MAIKIEQDVFGILKISPDLSIPIKRFTLTNSTGLTAQVITYGATVTSLKVPDKNGHIDDVILGFDDLEGYLGHEIENPYVGATIGRVTNRVVNGSFILDGQEVKLNTNVGNLHKHGRTKGFDKKVWETHLIEEKGVTLSYMSRDGEEGYPGDLLINVTFTLTSQNELCIEYQATTTNKTPVAVTSNPYFNLSGHQNTHNSLEGHVVLINADKFTPVDSKYVPTGQINDVTGTEFDLRTGQDLANLLRKLPHCYNHNFCVNGTPGERPRLAARVEEKSSGRVLELLTNQPGVQFYTSAFLPVVGATPLVGKDGVSYLKNGAFCLQSQNYPNAVNQPNFPDPVLTPGEVYRHQIVYRFSVTN